MQGFEFSEAVKHGVNHMFYGVVGSWLLQFEYETDDLLAQLGGPSLLLRRADEPRKSHEISS